VRLYLLVTLLVPAILLASACSDEGGKDSTVKVTLSEWEVVADPDSVPAGDVTFDVENEGEETHELMVVKTDFDASELPTEGDGSVDEGADGIDVIGETNDIDSGDGDGRVFELDAGEYVLLCNLVEDDESHFQQGMRTAFEVTAEGE
jgi:hypothetical protein